MKGPSLFTEPNEILWKNARKGVAKAFSSQHVKRMNRCCTEKTELWIANKLEPWIDGSKSFDVAKEMVYLTISVIMESAFEYKATEEECHMFLEEMELSVREFVMKQMMNPFRRLFGRFLPEAQRAHLAADRLQQLAFRILASYRQNKHHSVEDTVISRIVTNTSYKDDDARAADILIFLVGGHDTTGISLAWILICLAKHPAELENFRRAVQHIPREEWSNTKELKNIIREGMRLYPVVALGPARKLGRDFVYSDNSSKTTFLLPKGSVTMLPQILAFPNPHFYNDPNKFMPSRWENIDNNCFFPFALGKQDCVGQRLAMAELHSVIARLCLDYTFTIEEEGEIEYFLTLKPVGTRLQAHRRLG